MPTEDDAPRYAPPPAPKIYHFTHADNLPSLIAQGCLWSDAETLRRGILCTTIGMSEIKANRLNLRPVRCHSGTTVGQYVPFYFCPRSVMLYVLHKGNHPGLHYSGGQRPLVHLEADAADVVQWADAQSRRWAFTDRNAAAIYADFYGNVRDLNRLNWSAIAATQWSDSVIKEGKQAEFLLYESFPWSLVRRIGVFDDIILKQVKTALVRAAHVPVIEVRREWYYPET